MLSLGSIEADCVLSEPCYNEATYYTYSKTINLGAMTSPYSIENHIIMRYVIMRLKCTGKITKIEELINETTPTRT